LLIDNGNTCSGSLALLMIVIFDILSYSSDNFFAYAATSAGTVSSSVKIGDLRQLETQNFVIMILRGR